MRFTLIQDLEDQEKSKESKDLEQKEALSNTLISIIFILGEKR